MVYLYISVVGSLDIDSGSKAKNEKKFSFFYAFHLFHFHLIRIELPTTNNELNDIEAAAIRGII